MREQLQAGLNMCVAGIPWWTSDIGGFLGGDIKDPAFKELLVRWFAWGAFCPVFRMHGERSPWYEREQEFIDGVRQLTSGQDNEVWSFGEDNYEILKKYLFIRERLRPYIRSCMEQASKTGAPVMRPLFFDFAEDKRELERRGCVYVRTGSFSGTGHGGRCDRAQGISPSRYKMDGCLHEKGNTRAEINDDSTGTASM